VKVIGSKAKFAMLLGASSGQLRTIEVWVHGKNITPIDSSAYIPGFSVALASTERRLKQELNFLRFEALFFGQSVEEAFSRLAEASSPELEQAWSLLRFADWGPTTDDYLCFLIPVQGKLYLACRENSTKVVHAAQVVPHDLTSVLEGVLHELSTAAPGA
jgi:hypothetical protein